MVGVGDLLDVGVAEGALGTAHHVAQAAGIDKQHLATAVHGTTPTGRLVLGEEPDAHRNAGGAKELLGQRHHAAHQVVFHQLGADLTFAARLRCHRPIGHHHARRASGLQLRDDVLKPGVVRVLSRWYAVGPAAVRLHPVPVLDVERRVGHDVFHLYALVQVQREGIAPARPQVAVQAVNGEVHLRHPPGALHVLLPVDRQLHRVVIVRGQELLRLHEHAARTTARVVDPAFAGLQHLDDGAHNAGRCVELATPASLRQGELRQKILVHLPQQIPRPASTLPAEPQRVQQVQQFCQPTLVDAGVVEDPRQRARQRRIV